MVNFDKTIADIRFYRSVLEKSDKYPITAEYCYQLVSLLMESQSLINGKFFSVGYIEEKTKTLLQLAEAIRREVNGEWMTRNTEEWEKLDRVNEAIKQLERMMEKNE